MNFIINHIYFDDICLYCYNCFTVVSKFFFNFIVNTSYNHSLYIISLKEIFFSFIMNLGEIVGKHLLVI